MPGFWQRGGKAIPVYNVDDEGNPSGGGASSPSGPQPAVSSTSVTPATDSGPFPIAGKFTVTAPVMSDGQRGEVQIGQTGRVRVGLGLASSGVDGVSNANICFSAADSETNSNGRLFAFGGWVFNGTGWDRARGDTTGTYTVSKGSAGIATTQVSVGTSATQIVAARAGRGSVKITNLGTTDVFIGVAGVTTATGDLLLGSKGASIIVPSSAAIFGVAATAQSVSVLEVF